MTAFFPLLSLLAIAPTTPTAAATATPTATPTATKAATPQCPSDVDAPDVSVLTSYTERALSGRSMKALMSMTIKTPAWTRKLKMAVVTEGDDFALIRVVEGGPREVGLMTLKREKQLWNYLPQAGRVMKLPSGMLGDSWMGSDFTNDDLVRGTSLTRDFDAVVAPNVESTGKKTWRVTLVPKQNAVVVWGKVEMTIDRSNCLPLEERFYDEDGKIARSMLFAGVRQVGGRPFPAKMTVTPSDASRETVIEYEEVAFDVDIPADTFSLHRLQQGK